MGDPIYNVRIGKIARTLLYEDAEGEILFTFDVDLPDLKTIILERTSENSEKRQKNSPARIEMAFNNAKQYLLSCGYKVKIYPDEFESDG